MSLIGLGSGGWPAHDRIPREVDEHIDKTTRDTGLTLSIEAAAMDTGMYRVLWHPMASH